MDGLFAIIKAPLNLVIGAMNTLISGLNKVSFDIPNWDIFGSWAGKKFGINIPKIPLLRVGIANVPYDNYLAYLHQGERVLTKEENNAYKRKEQNREDAENINIILNIENFNNNSDKDIETLMKDIQFYLKKIKESKGNKNSKEVFA